jgi:hypothetical protein
MATFISLRTHFRQTTFTIPAKMTYCYDRLQRYDVVKVIHGPKAGTRGHVLEIRPNGYLTIKEIGNIKNVSARFRWFFNTYRFFLIGGAAPLPKRLSRFRSHSRSRVCR